VQLCDRTASACR